MPNEVMMIEIGLSQHSGPSPRATSQARRRCFCEAKQMSGENCRTSGQASMAFRPSGRTSKRHSSADLYVCAHQCRSAPGTDNETFIGTCKILRCGQLEPTSDTYHILEGSPVHRRPRVGGLSLRLECRERTAVRARPRAPLRLRSRSASACPPPRPPPPQGH